MLDRARVILRAEVRVVVSAVDIISGLRRQSVWERQVYGKRSAYSAPAVREVVHCEDESCEGFGGWVRCRTRGFGRDKAGLTGTRWWVG